jgi:phage-related minor tail protein
LTPELGKKIHESRKLSQKIYINRGQTGLDLDVVGDLVTRFTISYKKAHMSDKENKKVTYAMPEDSAISQIIEANSLFNRAKSMLETYLCGDDESKI